MHPKELSPRSAIVAKLNNTELPNPAEQHKIVMEKYSKVNDGKSFKAKFYNILNE